jgi:hypothetical protein
MSGKVTRLELKKGAISKLRNSPGVRDELARRAQLIADAATNGSSAPDAEYAVDSQRVNDNGKRLSGARASVRTANHPAVRDEAVDRTLTNSFRAGRG